MWGVDEKIEEGREDRIEKKTADAQIIGQEIHGEKQGKCRK